MSEYEKAHRTFKRLKAGVIEQDDLGPEEYGQLYLYFPDVLPDVDPRRRGR